MLDRKLIEMLQDKDRWLVLFCHHIKLTDNCWIWQGTGGHAGIAVFTYQETTIIAVKVAYNLAHDNPPDQPIPDDRILMHSCDNPMCVNPDHLSLGTHLKNHRDAVRKGRKSTERPPIKLSYFIAEEIRAKYAEGDITQLKLAQQYNVSLRNMQYLIARDIWN